MLNRRLKALLKQKSEAEISFSVQAKATHYPDSIKIYKPYTPFQKLLDGYEPVKKLRKGILKFKQNNEDNLSRSLRRTRANIRDIILCNQFELFVTFTFKADRYDLEKCKQKLKDWLKNQSRIHGKFEYLIIAELHKDGAYHFHGLLKHFKGSIKQGKHPRKDKILLSLGGYRSGYSNVQHIDQNPESYSKLAHYVSKYVTKDTPNLSGQNRYWASYGLARPKIEYNPAKWYERIEPSYEIEVDNGKLYYYDKADVPKEYHK